MATRLKTIEYAVPTLATLTDNSLTAMSGRTIYIPEFASTVTFKKVVAMVSCGEAVTVTPGNVSAKRLDVRFDGGTTTTYNNTTTHTGSGEQQEIFFMYDITDHFTTYWTTGTSKSLDLNVLINHSIGNMVNVNVSVYITYEYEDTEATQIKTVRIPLDHPITALASSKGTAIATIPNLDSYLPEASKTYRNIFINYEGNIQSTTTADFTINMEIDSLGAYTPTIREAAAASQVWARYLYTDLESLAGFTTSATHDLYVWGSTTNLFCHAQVWLTVTYEFDATSNNGMMVSLVLPSELASPMGGTTSNDAQRGMREFWIQEGNPSLQRLAFYAFWDQANTLGGLNWRLGNSSYTTYTDTASQLCGGNGCMIRDDTAFSAVRGRNVYYADAYRTDATDLGFNVGGYFLVNYTCDKPADGYGAANKTIFWNLANTGTGTAAVVRDIAATAPDIPESNYFLNAVGTNYKYITNSTGNAAGVTVLYEKTVAEGGIQWLPAYVDLGYTDPETGLRQCWSQVRSGFTRWPGDPDEDRLQFSGSRRWRCVLNNNAASYDYLDLIYTYHTITYTLSSTVSNSNAGTVTLGLHRKFEGKDEKVLEKTRTGNGQVEWVWYDDTQTMFVVAREDDTYVGRSGDFSFSGA